MERLQPELWPAVIGEESELVSNSSASHGLLVIFFFAVIMNSLQGQVDSTLNHPLIGRPGRL